MTSKTDHLSLLPADPYTTMLSYLDVEDLSRHCAVSRNSKILANTDAVWQMILPKGTIPQDINTKDYIKLHGVGTQKQLLQRIQAFVNKVQWNQKGAIRCSFPYNPTYNITVELAKSSTDRSNLKADLEEELIFIKPLLKMDDPNTANEPSSRYKRPIYTYSKIAATLPSFDDLLPIKIFHIVSDRLKKIAPPNPPAFIYPEQSRDIFISQSTQGLE